jgi:hypothetical protein
MRDIVTLPGRIGFEPEDKTKKHSAQSSWKKVAMVYFSGDLTEYYAWFISRRYGLTLNKPLRGAHISFINDSIRDLSLNGERTADEIDLAWGACKSRWDNREIQISLGLIPRTDGRSWWLNVHNEGRVMLQEIRSELGLGRPYFGMHMSIGYANEKNIEHSRYLHKLMIGGFIE